MVSVSVVALALFFGGLCYYLALKQKRKRLPPGPFGLPIIGSILSVDPKAHLTFDKWGKKYGPIVYAKLGLTEAVILSDPTLIREAFNEPVFNGRPDNRIFNVLADGKHGLLFTDGPEWTEQRRYVLRTLRDFGFGRKSMESLIYEEVKDMIGWIKVNENEPVEVNKKFGLAVLNALWMIMAGHRYDHDDTNQSAIFENVMETVNDEIMKRGYLIFFHQLTYIFPDWSGWNKLSNFVKPLVAVFDGAVVEHEKDPADPNHPRDFIDMYLNEIKNTTDPRSSFYGAAGRHSLVSAVGDLYVAGSKTTSTTLSWSILYLMTHPRVQAKLHDELDSVIGRTRIPELSDRSKTPYTEAVISEILRFSNLVPVGVFHTAMEDTVFRGYEIKKNTLIIGNHHSVHFSKELWGDPENFRPERFLSADEKTVLRSESLIPFSVGKRQCLGESLARDSIYLFITSIFQRFQAVPDPAHPSPSLVPEIGFLNEPTKYNVIFKDRIE